MAALVNEQRFRSLLVGRVLPWLDYTDVCAVACVCRRWHRWLTCTAAQRGITNRQRPMDATEIDALVHSMAQTFPLTCPGPSATRLRRRRIRPRNEPTERYVRRTLATIPLLDASIDPAARLDAVRRTLERYFARSALDPKSNIGTLDTTRVIERLTQARLSRFHPGVCVVAFRSKPTNKRLFAYHRCR